MDCGNKYNFNLWGQFSNCDPAALPWSSSKNCCQIIHSSPKLSQLETQKKKIPLPNENSIAWLAYACLASRCVLAEHKIMEKVAMDVKMNAIKEAEHRNA